MSAVRFQIYIFVGLLLLGIVSCTSPSIVDEEDALKTAVVKYNYALVIAYRDIDFGPLRKAANEHEAEKVRIIVEGYFQGDEFMESDIKEIVFKDIEVKETKAIVGTSEDWTYEWINARTGKVVDPVKDIHYEMVYHLVKKEGVWLVDKIEEEGKGEAKAAPEV